MNQTDGEKDTKRMISAEIHVQIHILIVLCVLVYIVTGIWILLRSYYITRLDLTSLFEPTFDTPTTGEEERRLHLFERVAPTKPFIVWWRSVQSETDPLKNYDRIFDCAICLEPVAKLSPIHTLRCRHVFHSHCLETWFMHYHYSCPLCLTPFQERVRHDISV